MKNVTGATRGQPRGRTGGTDTAMYAHVSPPIPATASPCWNPKLHDVTVNGAGDMLSQAELQAPWNLRPPLLIQVCVASLAPVKQPLIASPLLHCRWSLRAMPTLGCDIYRRPSVGRLSVPVLVFS